MFPHRGYFITGVLGGLYSSTAATVVLVRVDRTNPTPNRTMQAAVLAATGMMYLRLLLLVSLFSPAYLGLTAPPLLLFGMGTFALAVYFARLGAKEALMPVERVAGNPLAFGTAFLFAILFVAMLFLTRVIALEFGSSGLKVLVFGVGFTDIDPFVMSLLNGAYPAVSPSQLSGALLVAAGSNDLLKGIYAVTLGNWAANRSVMATLFCIGALTVGYGLLLF